MTIIGRPRAGTSPAAPARPGSQAGSQAGSSRAGAGLALALLSAATFGTSGTFGSALIQAGWSPAAAVTARISLSALILTVPAIVQLRGRWALLRRDAARVAAFGLIAVAGCQLFYFNAIQRLPVGVALLLEYLGVLLVVGWLWLRYGQRPRRRTVAGTAAALAGLALVLGLTGTARIDPLGVMWGLLAAVGLAIYFLLSAGTGHASRAEPLPPIAMTWAAMCTGGAALGLLGWAGLVPLTVRTGPVTLLGHQVSWVLPVAGLALVSSVVPYVAGIGAARRLGAKLASFAGLAEVLFAILFAWLLLGQLPTGMQFLGGAFILVGVALVRLDELGAPAAAGPQSSAAGPQSDGAGPRPDGAGPRAGRAGIEGVEPAWAGERRQATGQSRPSRSAQPSSVPSE
ncbi:MAG: EamA family transporter [Streptosporangiaceae bacterium]